MSAPADELETLLDEVVRHVPALPLDPLRRYVQEILCWNADIGLVSKKNSIPACRRLLIESAEFGDVVLRTLAAGSTPRIADVGSGAGFPGIVWRFLHADWTLVLIERREKKAAFLEQVVAQLALLRIDVIAGDARDAARLEPYHASFDVVATMAVGDPTRTARDVEGLLVPGGLFATTLPEEVVAPERCGRRLVLEDDVRAQFGRYALYRNRV
jgi:16S rRNA (guanine527-N7)-methyltransferase